MEAMSPNCLDVRLLYRNEEISKIIEEKRTRVQRNKKVKEKKNRAGERNVECEDSCHCTREQSGFAQFLAERRSVQTLATYSDILKPTFRLSEIKGKLHVQLHNVSWKT